MTGRERTATATLGGTHSEARPLPLRIRVVSGPDTGRELRLTQGTAVIGSREDCDLVLTDAAVSRRHATVELLGYRVRVTDLGSKNGTRCLGARVESADLPLGCRISVGKSELSLEPDLPAGELSEKRALQGLLGESVAMRRLFTQIERAAPSDSPLLVVGETGVGKERVARALHALSPRARGPFRVVDCQSAKGDLFTSALFGHVRGAFTGATGDHPGALEEADGGTLFLDGIDELPLELQPALLRALETKRFRRMGDRDERSANFRLLASTQRDLRLAMGNGAFRQDLYHRIAAVTLHVPALRERMEDVPLLVEQLGQELWGEKLALSPATLAVLSARPWAGNVRELRNVLEQLRALGEESVLGELGVKLDAAPGFYQAREVAKSAFEKSFLSSLLEKHGSVAAAAKAAKVARSHFYKLLEEHHLLPPRRRRR